MFKRRVGRIILCKSNKKLVIKQIKLVKSAVFSIVYAHTYNINICLHFLTTTFTELYKNVTKIV